MTFIITLIALIIERFFHWSHLRHWQWFARYQYFLNVRIGAWPKWILLVASVLPPVLLVLLVGCLMSGWWYNLPKLIFGVVVLVYCLGPKNMWLQIYSCIQAFNKEDTHSAMEQARQAFGMTGVDQPQAFHQAFTRAIFVAANERIFAVIFWFAVLGPWGAVLYRLMSLSANSAVLGITEIASKARCLLDWIPVRVFTFIFALGGHFTRVFTCWKQHAKEGPMSNDSMLSECGFAALSVPEHTSEEGVLEKEALELLDRVYVMGLVMLAVLVLVT